MDSVSGEEGGTPTVAAKHTTEHSCCHRRVRALTFAPDFIPWRRSGESWPRVGPGRRVFFLRISYGVASARAGARERA